MTTTMIKNPRLGSAAGEQTYFRVINSSRLPDLCHLLYCRWQSKFRSWRNHPTASPPFDRNVLGPQLQGVEKHDKEPWFSEENFSSGCNWHDTGIYDRLSNHWGQHSYSRMRGTWLGAETKHSVHYTSFANIKILSPWDLLLSYLLNLAV